ncbi:MAG: hypothetical protein U0T82_07825 [Bacteroidales bacterium]
MGSSEEKFSKWAIKEIVSIFILGMLMFWIQKCSNDSSGPKIASEILKQQNIVNDKKETFAEAVDIGLRHISYAYLSQVTIVKMGTKPSALEENSCLIKLYIFSNNQEIPKQFKKVLLPLNKGENIVVEFTKFLSLLSSEMGNEKILIDPKEFKFILPSDSIIIKSK